MGEGTIYPLMRRMQNDGLVDTRLVESNSGPPRKYYRLTSSGPRGLRGAEARVAGVHGFRQPVAGRKLMNRDAFLCILSDGLDGLPAHEIDDILADYVAYFDEARASGRSEEEVAAALGDPRRLARELRAESGCAAGKITAASAIRRPCCWRSAVWRRSISCSCCRCCSQ